MEYSAFITSGREAYVRAALDPETKPSAAQVAELAGKTTVPQDGRKTVGIILYPGFEVLDVYGPLEMWSYVKEFNVVLIAEQAGPVKSGQGTTTIADYSFTTAPDLDIIMVPGGFGTFSQLENAALMDFLRTRNEQTEITSSVCTGAALLARAGILKGHRATTNKRFFSLATDQDVSVDWVVEARWVESGKMITSSGVSAGTDMALALIARLYGVDRARGIASGVEYQWQEDPSLDPFAKFVTKQGTAP
ncbi:DJ-1/PfpI family protein [Emcibacter nanhaiensis]|uniref:DJ-1/PfpI family protein n=2 Tax=Emcibacter nanhaiensis TaxID=1505037 RepID=A0A501PC51_9PROT|nr:DJ-1/PfpI family protein [Emcibacter nanhaiensis]